jgi:SWI/SNF-related matrix-associated actin-dependent regulator of chromatin subfamily A member 5
LAGVFYIKMHAHFVARQRINGVTVTLREPQPEATPEKLDEEREATQLFIDTATDPYRHPASFQVQCLELVEPLTEEEIAEKEAYIAEDFTRLESMRLPSVRQGA